MGPKAGFVTGRARTQMTLAPEPPCRKQLRTLKNKIHEYIANRFLWLLLLFIFIIKIYRNDKIYLVYSVTAKEERPLLSKTRN